MVALYLEAYRQDWPQVGRVLEVRDGFLNIQWYSGTITSTWKPLSMRSAQNVEEPWTEMVSTTKLLFAPFSLTGSKRLPGEVRQDLRRQYEIIYS